MTTRTDAIAVRLLPRSRVVDVALIVGFALLVGAASQIRIPLPFTPVPVTGSTLAVLLTGAALGSSRAGISMLTYITMGLVGLPVYTAGGSGLEVLTGATGGYIVGYVLAAAAVGFFSERGLDRTLLGAAGAFGLGSVLIYACGVPVLMWATGWSLAEALLGGVVPFLIGDALKAVLAGFLLPFVHRLGDR